MILTKPAFYSEVQRGSVGPRMQIAGFPHPIEKASFKTLLSELSISQHNFCQIWVVTGLGRKREEKSKHFLLGTETSIFLKKLKTQSVFELICN